MKTIYRLPALPDLGNGYEYIEQFIDDAGKNEWDHAVDLNLDRVTVFSEKEGRYENIAIDPPSIPEEIEGMQTGELLKSPMIEMYDPEKIKRKRVFEHKLKTIREKGETVSSAHAEAFGVSLVLETPNQIASEIFGMGLNGQTKSGIYVDDGMHLVERKSYLGFQDTPKTLTLKVDVVADYTLDVGTKQYRLNAISYEGSQEGRHWVELSYFYPELVRQIASQTPPQSDFMAWLSPLFSAKQEAEAYLQCIADVLSSEETHWKQFRVLGEAAAVPLEAGQNEVQTAFARERADPQQALIADVRLTKDFLTDPRLGVLILISLKSPGCLLDRDPEKCQQALGEVRNDYADLFSPKTFQAVEELILASQSVRVGTPDLSVTGQEARVTPAVVAAEEVGAPEAVMVDNDPKSGSSLHTGEEENLENWVLLPPAPSPENAGPISSPSFMQSFRDFFRSPQMPKPSTDGNSQHPPSSLPRSLVL